jgi:hypothetical protein
LLAEDANREGEKLRDKWRDDPPTYLGLTCKPETSEWSRALSCLHLLQHSLHLGMHHIDSL